MRLLFASQRWSLWLDGLMHEKAFSTPFDDDSLTSQLHPWIDLGRVTSNTLQCHPRRKPKKVNVSPETPSFCEQPVLSISGWGQYPRSSPSCPQQEIPCPQLFPILLVGRRLGCGWLKVGGPWNGACDRTGQLQSH